jgi:hypothetical protein
MRDRRHRALVPLIWLPTVRPKPCDSCGFGEMKHSWVIRYTRLMLYRENAHFSPTYYGEGYPRLSSPAYVENNRLNGFSLTGSLNNVGK